MTEIVMDGMCKGCEFADLELVSVSLFGRIKWDVRCKHKDACLRMKFKTTKESQGEVDDGQRSEKNHKAST